MGAATRVVSRTADRVRSWPGQLRHGTDDRLRQLRRPEGRARYQLTQTAKATLAAVLAWFIAGDLVGNEAAWLAPATAVLMAHSTVYRSLADGLKRVAAVTAGVMIAATAGAVFGLSLFGLLLVVPLSLLGAKLRWVSAQGEYIATTAVLLLAFGVATDLTFLRSYVVDTAIGVVIGALVNVLLFPPAYQRTAREAISDLATDIADVFREVAEGLRSGWRATDADHWRRRADRLGVEGARSALEWNKESLRWNPWPRRGNSHRPHYYEPAVDVLRHIAIDLQSLTQALREGAEYASADRQDGEDGHEQLLASVPPLHDDLAPLLDAVAEMVDTFGDEPVLRGGGLGESVEQSLAQAENLYRDMADRLPESHITGPRPFATTGSVMLLVRRILDQLTNADHQPAG